MGHIGVDESGKGDYFGYLVVAAVYVDKNVEKKLQYLKIKDSKVMVDSSILKISSKIKKICPYEIVKISPEKYNILYKKFGNLNKLLAWSHARVIENLLKKVSCNLIIVDKFADENVIKDVLLEKGKSAKIVQKIKAESDIAVAAASIVARSEFLKALRQLSLLIGYKLPKGATHVENAAKEIIKKHGKEILSNIAKVHFRTTKKLNI